MIPRLLRKPVSDVLVRLTPASFGYDSLGLKLRWFEQMAGEKGIGEALANAVSFFRFNPAEKGQLFTNRIAANLDLHDAASEISDRYYESDAEEPIERMMYTDFCTRLPEHLLMLVDRMGMTHSVEIRSPLVDKELVEFMATIPLHMKVRGNKSRIIWRGLADRLLPESIARRKKRGFRFPLAYWFAVKLYPFVRNVFGESTLCEDGIFNKQYLLDILEEHRQRRIDHSWRIWMLLNLEVWYRMYIRGSSLEGVQQWIDQQANKS
jgi:asparagine synthase (glutamine-hydrolysing)